MKTVRLFLGIRALSFVRLVVAPALESIARSRSPLLEPFVRIFSR
jgi:hypothetical protein